MSIVNVDCTNLENNVHCTHGPTLKFSRLVKGRLKVFYACSAYRDRKDCSFYMNEGGKPPYELVEWKRKTLPTIQHDLIIKKLEDFKNIKSKKKYFCQTCFDFVFPQENDLHKTHTLTSINKNCDISPRCLLFPITKNKSEAQYWFSKKTLDFLITNIKQTNIEKVLCIGTPTVHDHLLSCNINSILLDIDHRYHWFYKKSEFIWFNMFNFHFMSDEDCGLRTLTNFVKESIVLVIVDPPFGARIEPLEYTISRLLEFASEKLLVLLILPYFMEPQVLKSFPNYEMLDFPIEYTNHKKFKDKGSMKSSPVRIFTNIPPKDFTFPSDEGYVFCEPCKAWRGKLNKHCEKCGVCPSKNGARYQHCALCDACVKLSWQHCNCCNKCALPGHNCKNPLPNKKRKHKH